MQEQTFSIFQEVVELDPEARNAYYRTHHVADDVRQEVESLLQFDTEEDSLSEDIAAAVKEILEESEAPSQPGMCGPYRLVQKIGEGGMGTVYLGERADGEVEQRVAIKIVRSGADTPSFRARFLRERRIVASLNHPGIARVIDAGHTAEGQPYLVMEYIEGVPLDKYCAGLEPSAALRLFLQACEAVSYAHRNLVIHRDLKPSNILVDGAGRLKLLDFGIARILDGSEETRTLVQALTPGYASPEQIRGEAQTTATDIYSLGAVLYKVLSGQTPQSGPPGATSAIVPPSQVKPGLSRDIDFIILRALRRNPDDRYPSVVALAEDVTAFLENRPVRARSGNTWYRLRKTLRRHWIPAIAAAGVLISLGGGMIIANQERALAERRFSQVRMLANEMFALDEEISSVPGTTKARHKLVSIALDYLQRLGQEARNDRMLAFEIGSGYLRVAKVQGIPTGLNLGRMADAEESLLKADGFIDGVIAASPHDRAALLVSAEIAHARMILAQTARRTDLAAAFAQKAASRLETLEASGGPLGDGLDEVTQIYGNIALAYSNMRRLDEAVLYARRSSDGARKKSGKAYSGGLMILANALRYRGDLEEALKTVREARALMQDDPDSVARTNNLIIAMWREGRILGEEGEISLNRPREAIAVFQNAFDMADTLVRQDAAEYLGRMRLAGTARNLADILRSTDPKEALRIYDYALARSREVKNEESVRDQTLLLAGSAYALRRLHRPEEAKQRIDQAFELMRQEGSYPAASIRPGQEPVEVLRSLGDHYAETGKLAEAVRTYQEIVDKLMASHPTPETDLRDANALSVIQQRLSLLERQSGQKADADALDRLRRELWLRWQRKLPGNDFVQRKLAEIPPV